MSRRGYSITVAMMIVICLTALSNCCYALEADHFVSSSKLAGGNWVKVELPTAGVYEITSDELSQMGFDDINSVKVFGRRAKMMSESLEDTDFDDLEQVSTAIFEDKICFYCSGTFARSFTTYKDEIFVEIATNCYSVSSYYFITDDESYASLEIEQASGDVSTDTDVTESYAVSHHERDLVSIGQTGKKFLGEAFDKNNELSLTLDVPRYVSDTPINFYAKVGAYTSVRAVLTITLGGSEVDFCGSKVAVAASTSSHAFYAMAYGRGTVTPLTDESPMQCDLALSTTGSIDVANLDAITLLYKQTNTLATDSAQVALLFKELAATDRIVVDGASSSCVAWMVEDLGVQAQYELTDEGSGAYFAPGVDSEYVDFVVFDPSMTLLKVSSYEAVENQNLHGMDVPDMLIITQPGLLEQAQKLADMHAVHDSMDVAIVEQDKIFNEFSSGAADAMAIRLMAKMFFCRDSVKFKHLLLLGGGSYDNRKLIGTYSDNMLLTYQSDYSLSETQSYTCDNFFGMLGDNAGSTITKIPVSIGVGRIPAKTVSQAEAAVNKIVDYVTNPDYGVWRNRVMLSADEGDSDLYMYQAEDIQAYFAENTVTDPVFSKAYVEEFELNGDGVCEDGRDHFISQLKRGLLFVTFIGHGMPKYLTLTAEMYRMIDALEQTYDHLPFITFASCDVTRFDGDEVGLAEEMLFKEGGGMIGGICSARTVYASENHVLNLQIIKNLFNLDPDGKSPTVGYAFGEAIRSYGTASNLNKLNFQLLGDPAMRLNFPQNLAEVTSIGGTDISDGSTVASISPMTEVTISGVIRALDGSVDTDFDGDVIVTLYDRQVYFDTFTSTSDTSSAYESYHQRGELSQADGRVTAGYWEATLLVSPDCTAWGETGLIAVLAHRDDSELIVDGSTENVIITKYDESVAITDDTPPVIEEMYLNDESFTNGDVVLYDPQLHVEITDDYGIYTQTIAMAKSLTLMLDGSKSYSQARNIVNLTESGRRATIDMTLTDLSAGSHTLVLRVYDFAGNSADATIDFFVEVSAATASAVADSDKVRDEVTFTLSHTFSSEPQNTVYVLDRAGNTVWSDTFSGDEYTWELVGNDGDRVPSGRYRYYFTLESGASRAHTPMQTLVVLDP